MSAFPCFFYASACHSCQPRRACAVAKLSSAQQMVFRVHRLGCTGGWPGGALLCVHGCPSSNTVRCCSRKPHGNRSRLRPALGCWLTGRTTPTAGGAVGVVYGIGNREENVANRSERAGGRVCGSEFRDYNVVSGGHRPPRCCSLPLPGDRRHALPALKAVQEFLVRHVSSACLQATTLCISKA